MGLRPSIWQQLGAILKPSACSYEPKLLLMPWMEEVTLLFRYPYEPCTCGNWYRELRMTKITHNDNFCDCCISHELKPGLQYVELGSRTTSGNSDQGDNCVMSGDAVTLTTPYGGSSHASPKAVWVLLYLSSVSALAASLGYPDKVQAW